MIIEAIVGIVVPVYLLCITAPSFILNGLILLTFFKAKELRTPSNLLSVHFSVVGIIVSTIYSPFAVAAFINVMIFCDCSVLYYHWFFGHIFHYGLYPLNILILTLSYLLILKYSTSVLTIFRALMAIIIIWILSVLSNFPAILITPPSVFIDCCETVCDNGTEMCSTPLEQSFTPRLFSQASNVYFHIRDGLIILMPSVIVFVATASSYCIYRRSTMKSSLSLEVRMLLLPILMTFIIAVYLLGQDFINWQPTQTTDDRYPGILIFVVLHMLWDINGVVFPILILFFNVKLRLRCFEVLMCKVHYTKNMATVRFRSQPNQDQQVVLTGSVSNEHEPATTTNSMANRIIDS